MLNKDTPIAECRNLGAASAKVLASVGVECYGDLHDKGAIAVFVSLAMLENKQPNLNLLYAMLGAIENRHWTEYSHQKGELLLIVESQLEFHKKTNAKI